MAERIRILSEKEQEQQQAMQRRAHLLAMAAKHNVEQGTRGGMREVRKLLKKFKNNVPMCPRCETRNTRPVPSEPRFRCRDCGTYVEVPVVTKATVQEVEDGGEQK